MDLELINRITDILTFLQLRTRNANSLHLFDINTRAEYFYRDFLNLVYGWKLKNANTVRMNEAYIDLIDDVSAEKIAIQVTSQNDSGKIRKTVDGFCKDVDNKQFKLKIMLISKEAKEYRADFSRGGQFEFDAETDVIDIPALLNEIADKDIDSLEQIKIFLEKHVNFTTSAQKFYPTNFIPDLKYFVGRDELLANLKSTLATHQKASIHDISGLGKTFACYKFADYHKEVYSKIFFVNCAKEAMMESLARLGRMLNPGVERATQEDQASAFKNCLKTNMGWLAIFDNVDEPASLVRFVPNNPEAHCLFTSNVPKIRNLGKEVSIGTLEKENAAKLLFRRSKANEDAEISFTNDSEKTAFWEIVEDLDGLPVALNTTGAFIEERGISYTDYLENLDASPDLYLEHSDEFDPYKKTVLRAFDLALDANTDSMIDKLYQAASLIAPDDIPEEFLRAFLVVIDEEFAASPRQNILWQKVRNQFQGFDLFKYDEDSESFSTHRLIQKCIQLRLGVERILYWEKVLDLLLDFFPVYDYSNKARCEKYYQHTVTALKNVDRAEFETEASIALYFGAARYQELLGSYTQAMEFYKKNLEISQRVLGEEHEQTASSLNNMARIYDIQGQYDKAIEYFRQSITIGKRTIGEAHPSYAIRLNNLAEVYRKMGEYDVAIELYEEAIKITGNALGKEHANYATRLNNLALIHSAHGEYDKAIELFEQAIKIDEKTIGNDHPNHAARLYNLASIYSNKKKYSEALPLFQEALRIWEANLPPEHPEIAMVKRSIETCRRMLVNE